MARDRVKAKGRRESGAFVPIPCAVLNCANYKKLTPRATRLLFDLCGFLNFKKGGTVNNGNLSTALTVLKPFGWKSPDTLSKAIAELRYYGFIIQTRPGGRNQCSLYAVAWWAVDDCHRDVLPTKAPSMEWKTEKPLFKFKTKNPQIRYFGKVNTKIELTGESKT